MEGPRAGGLVLYKSRPARVKEVVEGRLDLELADGGTQKVRPKDVALLHPGPCALSRLAPPQALEEVDTVRQLLAAEGDAGGQTVDLRTLSELLYGDHTPASAWGSWQLVADGLHFEGTPDRVRPRTQAQVDAERRRRDEVAAAAAAWAAFLQRVRQGRCSPEAGDGNYLREVEELAEGRRERSRLLRELGRGESPEHAHALLLQLGWWDAQRLPYPARAGISLSPPTGALVAPAAAEERVDLTHLAALAIDDEGNRDPDDAVAVDDDGALWVHVADVAWQVPSGSPADLEARARGSTLYLPDGPIPMLPPAAVATLGLGLAADGVGPALSFRLALDAAGAIAAVDVVRARVRVERLTYEQAEARLDGDERLARVAALAERSRQRRLAAGAVDLEWPEVRIRVRRSGDGGPAVIDIRPLPMLRSRRAVAETMILAGEGAARLACQRGIPFPFSVQDPSAVTADEGPPRTGLAAAFALRRRQQPGRVSGDPSPHRGLGVEAYARATSPLRRYLDLLVHQQLRAALDGGEPLTATELMECAGAAEAVAGSVRATERQANRHWTLLYLAQQPGWQGRGVLIDTRGRRGLLLIPQLALEASVSLPDGGVPGAEYTVTVRSVDLPRLDLHLELAPA